MADDQYLSALRARALENERADYIRRYEGVQWGPSEQSAFDQQWDQMSLAQALQYGGGGVNATGNRFGEIDLAGDDPLVAQFLEQFGERQWTDAQGNPIERPDSGNSAATGYAMGYGDPTYGGYEGRNILQDDSRIIRLPDGRYIREAGNLNSGEIAGAQREDETQSRRMRQQGAMMAAAVLGGGMAANAGLFGDLGLSTSGSGSGLLGGAEAGYGLGGSAGEAAATGGMGMGATPAAAIPGNLSWTTPASTIPEMAALPELLPATLPGASPYLGAESLADMPWTPPESTIPPLSDIPEILGPEGSWWDTAREILGGGEGNPGGGILGMMGGQQAPRIGERRQDNDPYGLMASGYGPWSGFVNEDDKAKKVAEAMMKRKQTNPWG